MRRYSIAILVGLLSIFPELAVAEPVKGSRVVELVMMGQSVPPRPAEQHAAEPSPVNPEPFLLHDLRRRYVEFRMAQEFAVPETGNGAPSLTGAAVPPASSIPVPYWMKSAPDLAPTLTYSAGCAPLAYRPSGFLKADAEARRAAYYGMMSAIACEQGLPTGLFDAMIIRESRYNPAALSPKKALGLAQLMPGTAAYLGIDPYDPAQNLRGGARYLREQLDRFGQVHLALAAYNAGPGRIRGGVIPRIIETQNYVADILGNWSRLAGNSEVPAGAAQPAMPNRREARVSAF